MPMENIDNTKNISRRHFLNSIGFGGAGLVILGSYGFRLSYSPSKDKIRAIIVDFEKCSGCRTCEAVCAENKLRVIINGEEHNGLANLRHSNIMVHHFNPDIDIPSTCALCDDAPCIEACPVEPHPETGRKALYRDENMGTILNDLERCIGCQSCDFACKNNRAGVIKPNPETGSPENICNLCGGDPQCVRNCPYDALKYAEFDNSYRFRAMAPRQIAEEMIMKMYNLKLEEV